MDWACMGAPGPVSASGTTGQVAEVRHDGWAGLLAGPIPVGQVDLGRQCAAVAVGEMRAAVGRWPLRRRACHELRGAAAVEVLDVAVLPTGPFVCAHISGLA